MSTGYQTSSSEASHQRVLQSDVCDRILTRIYANAAILASEVVDYSADNNVSWDDRVDAIVTSRLWGFPIMVSLLAIVFWLTVAGANIPSQLIAQFLFGVETYLSSLAAWARAPNWLHGFLVLGVYRGLAWVVSVMLPPMCIFFPLFSILEDLGYLPRVAFNLDRIFRAAGAHGKQALTMAMGFGCNAAAIVSTRIIESPRERLIAILTNNFVPCNGRFPTLITLGSLIALTGAGTVHNLIISSVFVVGIVILGVIITLAVSWMLSHTFLRGIPSQFTLELPPYRLPQPGRLIVRALLDRALAILYRAVIVAAPAGGVTWILANYYWRDASILAHLASAFDGFGRVLGLDGMILVAFILGLPANEIVMPIMLMGYVSSGAMLEFNGLQQLKTLLVDTQGWTWLTAANMMLFSLLHYPCGTTLLTIYKETRSLKWSALATLMPLAIAIAVTYGVAQISRSLGWVP